MSDAFRIHDDQRPPMQSRVPFRFLASTLSAAVGRNGYYIASAWILVEAGYGSSSVATLLAIVSVVELLASPLVGVAADQFDRRRLNIAADLSRFAIMLAMACALLHENVFLTICFSAVVFAFCDRVALTCSQAVIPAVARRGDLVASNSLIFFVMQFGCLAAALLFGSLLNEHSPALAYIVLAMFFLASAASLFSMRPDSSSYSICGARRFALDIDPGLLRLFAVYALLYGGAVLISVMGSAFVFEEQKGAAVDFGHVEAAWSAGSLVGAIALNRLARAISAHMLHLALLGSTALALMALILMSAPWTLVVFAALGFFYNLGRVSVEVTLQSRASHRVLGRAKGTMHSFAVALGLAIFSVTAALGDTVSPSTIFFGFGVMLVIGVPAIGIGLARQKIGS
ncbi:MULTISPECIES: MFS transporter [unclassified Mesorhizobium]|uniref:MFS transporter n=1 Tax=unclassified Mesorhizobium TaxID=325217 RepID=UPI002417067B|nr:MULTISPECIES: MFS transporter [unclassified Mesorhizobium]MDG4887857.1 MFS transporter [Mesorhizobium sp. WSM4887]